MQLIGVLCIISWQSCPKYKAVPCIPFLTCNAAAGTVDIGHAKSPYPCIDILQMHDGVSITPHTVPLSCVVLFIIAQKMVCSLPKLR